MNMDWFSVDFHIRLIGVLAFVFVAYAFWLGQPKARAPLPYEHNNPVLALSLAKTGAEIDQIKTADQDGEIATQLKKDWGFIFASPTERARGQMVRMGGRSCSDGCCHLRSGRKHRHVEGPY